VANTEMTAGQFLRRRGLANEEQVSVLRSHVFVSGRVVQEGAFRASMRRHAEELGLRGWTHSTQVSRVEAVFEGEPAAVRRMIRRGGPPHLCTPRNTLTRSHRLRDQM